MESGKILNQCRLFFPDLRNCLKREKRIGIWGIHQDLHAGHLEVHKQIRERCDILVGVYYSNWGSLIESLTGCIEYQDPPINYDLLAQFHKLNDETFVMSEDIFLGQYNYTKSDLWPMILDQLPNDQIIPEMREKPARNILLSHLRTAQAMKVIFNEQIDCKYVISGGGVRDGWRWKFKEWYESKYPDHEYILINPVLDDQDNSFSGSRKFPVGKKLLLPEFETKDDVQKYNDMKCLYFFKTNGYMYAGFEKDGKTFTEGVKI